MIRPIYELKCRNLTDSGETAYYHWRIHRFWFWQNPIKWVHEQMDGMGHRVIFDSLRRVS